MENKYTEKTEGKSLWKQAHTPLFYYSRPNFSFDYRMQEYKQIGKRRHNRTVLSIVEQNEKGKNK